MRRDGLRKMEFDKDHKHNRDNRNMLKIKIRKSHPLAQVPRYMTKGAAAMDLTSVEETTILPGQTTLVDTGLAFELPEGLCLQVLSRSGLAAKYGVFIPNGPGLIDPDFRGTVKVILTNNGAYAFKVKVGERIAQMLLTKFERVTLEEGELNETERGKGGLGSTGR
jgi:dUTP pyrophosphatase